jgi:hypothetical protein
MPDIPVTVDPKLAVTNTEQKLALDKAFDEAFGPIDEGQKVQEPKQPKAEAELPATEEHQEETLPAGEESKEEGGKAEQASAAALKPGESGHPDDEPDEEIDQYKIHPDTKPETLATFRELRGQLKLSRKQQNELRQRVQKYELDQQSRQPLPVSDPSVQKELEELRGFRQRNQFLDDSTYHTNYEEPVRQVFDDIINEVKRLSPDPQQAADWERQVRGAGPDTLDRKYWNEGVINQCQDPLDRDRLIRKVSGLLEAQERRNAFRQKMANEPDAYQKYQHETAAKYWEDFARDTHDEVEKHKAHLGEWATLRDPALAKNAAEKAAIEAHNKVYAEYENLFKAMITDAATQGPRGMTRVALKAVAGEKHKQDLESANKKIAKLSSELEAARGELNKIAGARSRVAQPSSGARPNGEQPPPKRKASQSLDSAFKDFFGPP